MSVNVEFLTTPIPYEETHASTKYEKVKFDIVTVQNTVHKCALPMYESKRGVEGLFHCKDRFDDKANDYAFDAADHFNYFRRILDQVSQRWWRNRVAQLPQNAPRTMDEFNTVFEEFVTAESGCLNPRDALIAYLETEECKKHRKADVRTHANRIENLCHYANRLTGVRGDLTQAEITRVIYNSFPNHWLNEFRLARGNPNNVGRDVIMEFFMTKKAVQDHAEDQHKKRKSKDEKDSTDNNKNKGKNNNKKNKQGNEGQMCRKHKTHLWSECSDNPKSKNYYLNPKSPFFRGNRDDTRSGGRGGYGRGNGRDNYSSGRGSGRGYGRNGNGYGGREQHHNDYRGYDKSGGDRNDQHDPYHTDHHGSGGGRGSHDRSGNHDGYHNYRPGGWY
ncbi:MAG: hypothetical protein ACKO63_20745 [Nodosilinea sp.]